MVLASADRTPPRPTATAGQKSRGGQRERLICRIVKPLVFLLGLAPAVWLAWLAFTGGLGVNPIEALVRSTGDWALRLLLISLAVSPVKEIFGWAVVIRFRRMLGLFAFFYVVVHLSMWIGVDQYFAWALIWADIVKRPYITIGMLAFLLLLPLAATSTAGMIKRLGARRWKRLHCAVYPAAMLGCLHFALLVKADLRQPLIYAALLAALLGWRAATRWLPRPPAPSDAHAYRPVRQTTPCADR